MMAAVASGDVLSSCLRTPETDPVQVTPLRRLRQRRGPPDAEPRRRTVLESAASLGLAALVATALLGALGTLGDAVGGAKPTLPETVLSAAAAVRGKSDRG